MWLTYIEEHFSVFIFENWDATVQYKFVKNVLFFLFNYVIVYEMQVYSLLSPAKNSSVFILA
jgi:hypothetical protein